MNVENRHRLVYHADLGLFLLLATPWVNQQLLTLIFSFGQQELYQGAAAQAITVFVGLMGVLGFGLSYLRLGVDDSRTVVARSALVKALAALWLFKRAELDANMAETTASLTSLLQRERMVDELVEELMPMIKSRLRARVRDMLNGKEES